MTVLQIFQVVSPFLSIAAIIVFTLAYFWAQARNGTDKAEDKRNNVANEVIATYETRIKQLEDAMALQKIEFEKERETSQKDRLELSNQISKLQGVLEEKEKQVAILQERNPETVEILKKLGEALSTTNPATIAANEYMKNGTEFMQQARDFMQQDREYKSVALPIIKELKDYLKIK